MRLPKPDYRLIQNEYNRIQSRMLDATGLKHARLQDTTTPSKCKCGAASVGSNGHANYCQLLKK